MVAADPDHSQRYIQRFKDMADQGADLAGEARLVDAMVPRGSHILDAGCGPGRVGGRLATLGHRVVGVDVDPTLVAEAELNHPQGRWLVGDLAELDLPAKGILNPFDLIVSAGNVMGFLAESTRAEVLHRLALHLAPQGRAVIGFGAGRGYAFADFLDDAARGGLELQVGLATWDLKPFTEDSDFLVAIFGRA